MMEYGHLVYYKLYINNLLYVEYYAYSKPFPLIEDFRWEMGYTDKMNFNDIDNLGEE